MEAKVEQRIIIKFLSNQHSINIREQGSAVGRYQQTICELVRESRRENCAALLRIGLK
jgi:hypothetical protein